MKLKIIVLILAGAAVLSACKKQNNDQAGKANVNEVAAKYAANMTPADARSYLSVLSGDDFEGRETGKPGGDKTANYIAGEFEKLGLEGPVSGSYLFNVPLSENEFIVSSFTVNGSAYTNGADYYANDAVTANTVSASDVVFIGYGISAGNYDDLKAIDIAGKVVLVINDGEPTKNGISKITGTSTPSAWAASPTMRIQYLRGKGPALILAVNPNITGTLKKYGDHLSGNRVFIKGAETAPPSQAAVLNISPEIANNLLKNSGTTYEALKTGIDNSGNPNTQNVTAGVSASYSSQQKDVNAADVLGLLPGTDLKDEILVISAHYDHLGLNAFGADHVFNGADDDGSGITGVLEIARAFAQAKKEGHGPRRSILFLGNVGEEKGLLGSKYYSDHPVFSMANTITDLNIDMIGRVGFDYMGQRDSANYVYVIGSAVLSKDLHDINEQANSGNTKLELDYSEDAAIASGDPNASYYRSDHYNFAKHNVPIIFYFNGTHPDYHKPTDEIGKINFPLLIKRAQLVFYTAWTLANRDKRPALNQ